MSLSVEPGEVFGVIGHNGSGKSTLLKLLAGVMRPSEGKVEISGRVAPLIEVGAGFHPELTGRENIYLNGAIMGLPHRVVQQRFDEIVAFSGLEAFLDRPVKHYSSGMYMRLGFSIAVHVEPAVLLVDEVLAVGDQAFQQACLTRVRELRDQGVAVVLVSHNLFAVTRMCQRALLLKHGRPLFSGPSSECVREYEADLRRDTLVASAEAASQSPTRITRLEIPSAAPGQRALLQSGDSLTVEFEVTSETRIEKPLWVFSIIRI
ncbi:MAG: ABC transporter ATP-binding protein, partial [Candidatus Xenobia bacterium]